MNDNYLDPCEYLASDGGDMQDPVIQDINEYLYEEAKFNKAVEAMIPVVMEDYTFFEEFLMVEYPEHYNTYSDNDLENLFNECRKTKGGMPLLDKWLEYVNNEAVRRVEG